MTEPVSWKLKAIAAVAAVAIIAAAGAAFSWWVTSTSYDADIATLNQTHADERAQWKTDKAAISNKAQEETAAALQRTKAAQDALAALDAQKSKELADAEHENNALRDDVAAGNKRVRILAANLATANLAARQHAASGNTPATGVGDGTYAELSTEAGQRILDIRAGVIRKEAQLETLQDYVEKVVKQCKR